LLLLAMATAGCIDVEGGAAELSWSLRTFEGDGLDSDACADLDMDRIRLCWTSLDDAGAASGCRPGASASWECERGSGVTGFVIPAGRTSFWIEPVCNDGVVARTTTYQAPPPLVRQVFEGQVVTLNSLLLVVTNPKECQPPECTCDRL
jgi:hypothetical protein